MMTSDHHAEFKLPPAATAVGGPESTQTEGAEKAIRVPAGNDRFGQERQVFGTLPITFKVSPQETGGSLLILEQNNTEKGGPPKHLHHQQEEWFYVIHGQYLVEIGDEQYHLGPGDCVLAPRKVPHVWAYLGGEPGRMLVAFQPAGKMEAFFVEATQLMGSPKKAELAALFAAHEMELTGPCLIVE